MEQVNLNVFEKWEGSEYAERCALALFKIVSQEGTYYALTVVYLPSHQQRLGMAAALQAVHSTEGNAVTLAHMPKEYTECAYMPELMNGEHYTLVPVSGDAGAAFGPVGDFAATVLTKGSTHLQTDNTVVVKLPGSFSSDTNNRGLVDEEVYQRGPIWENKVLVELESNEVTPVIRNGRTVAVERGVRVSPVNVYTDTSTHEPLTLVACEPGYMSDDEEFTESMVEMQARLEKEMDDERKAQREERIRKRQAEQNKAVPMDTTPAHTDPAAIPGMQLHMLPPKGAVMADFSNSGKVTVDLTQSVDEARLPPATPGVQLLIHKARLVAAGLAPPSVMPS